jgi:hypothetical protein
MIYVETGFKINNGQLVAGQALARSESHGVRKSWKNNINMDPLRNRHYRYQFRKRYSYSRGLIAQDEMKTSFTS